MGEGWGGQCWLIFKVTDPPGGLLRTLGEWVPARSPARFKKKAWTTVVKVVIPVFVMFIWYVSPHRAEFLVSKFSAIASVLLFDFFSVYSVLILFLFPVTVYLQAPLRRIDFVAVLHFPAAVHNPRLSEATGNHPGIFQSQVIRCILLIICNNTFFK